MERISFRSASDSDGITKGRKDIGQQRSLHRMVAVKQPLCFLGARCVKIFLIQCLHSRIFMGKSHRSLLVKAVKYTAAWNCFFSVGSIDRLTSTACASAGTRHNLDKLVVDFPAAEGFQQHPCITKPAGNRAVNRCGSKVERCFPPASALQCVCADFAEGIGGRVFAIHKKICRAQLPLRLRLRQRSHPRQSRRPEVHQMGIPQASTGQAVRRVSCVQVRGWSAQDPHPDPRLPHPYREVRIPIFSLYRA